MPIPLQIGPVHPLFSAIHDSWRPTKVPQIPKGNHPTGEVDVCKMPRSRSTKSRILHFKASPPEGISPFDAEASILNRPSTNPATGSTRSWTSCTRARHTSLASYKYKRCQTRRTIFWENSFAFLRPLASVSTYDVYKSTYLPRQ